MRLFWRLKLSFSFPKKAVSFPDWSINLMPCREDLNTCLFMFTSLRLLFLHCSLWGGQTPTNRISSLCVVCCRLRHETTMYYAALISLTLFKHTMEPSLSFFSSNGHLKHPHCISIIIRVSLHQQLGKVCCTLTSKREMKTNVGEINEVSHPVSNILFLSGLHLHSLCG